ncbi:MAG TPA: helix-turn-helix transcriptional regulator [Anaerolineales bacterium]|nr:helix-turn-helix transcriptional regulator [Anaerolineales bacterium]
MAKAATPESFLPLTPAVFHILLALADGEKHGYAIMQDIEGATDGRVQMGPGTLYGSIKRMLAAGLIEESDDRPDPTLDDERRRYYRQSGLGRKVLRRETERMAELMALARRKHVWAVAGSRSTLPVASLRSG